MEKLKPAQADSQRGRSAALVHGLAFLAAALALGAVWAVGMKSKSDDAVKILGMGLIAVAVMTLWSVVLAIQALWRGEPRAWPRSVLCVFTIEATALCICLGLSIRSVPENTLVRAGLLVFLPFGMLLSVVAVPVAFWRVRRAERAEIAAKKPEWNNRRRGKHGFAWYSGIFTILTILLLPWPLFLFCAGSAANSHGDWRHPIARRTPDFIRNTVAFLLEQSTLQPVVALHEQIVKNGYLSQIELYRHLNGTSSVLKWRAEIGIDNSEPAAALEFAIDVAGGQRTCTTPMAEAAAWIIGKYGSADQIRDFLNPAKSPPVRFREMLVFRLIENRRMEFVPELKRLVEMGSPERATALWALITLAPPMEFEQIWLKQLADQNPKTRCEAAGFICNISAPDTRTRMCLACLKHYDVQVRHCFLEVVTFNATLQARQDIQISFVERLMELLDEHDLVQRRGAVWLLSYIVGADANKTPKPVSSLSGTSATRGGKPSPEIPGESETVEVMRAATRKWLTEHKR